MPKRSRDPPTKRILLRKEQFRFPGNVSLARNRRDHASVLYRHAAIKIRSQYSLLPPDPARSEVSILIETSHLRAGSRSAGRAIVGIAGTQNKIGAVSVRRLRSPEQFNVVDLVAIRSRDAIAH